MNRKTHALRQARGFTLVELLVAITIAAIMMTAALATYNVTLETSEQIKALGEPMKTGPLVLDMIQEDIENIWMFNIKENRVFLGENKDIVGVTADRIHMIVGGRTSFPVVLPDDSLRHAPYAEVSYMLKTNPDNPDLLELWRREDPLIDKDMTRGGNYQLLTDRVRSFNVTYYEELGREAEPLDVWDSNERGILPRVIKIELEIERRSDTFNKLSGVEVDDIGSRTLKFTRYVVIDEATANLMQPGIALVPSIPTGAPVAENAKLANPMGGAGARGNITSNAGQRGQRGKQDQRGRGGKGAGPGLDVPGRGQGQGQNINFQDIINRFGRGTGGNTGGGNRSSGGNRSGGGRR